MRKQKWEKKEVVEGYNDHCMVGNYKFIRLWKEGKKSKEPMLPA